MSIKYNGKTIAGGYIPSYSTESSAGVVRFATEQEFKNYSKDTAVTPYQVSNYGTELLSSGAEMLNNSGLITNCITEIPQRIKYTLDNGTLTIKAGSVVIVPYGVQDLTATYPVGSTFINENVKVYDTCYADGKFFVWAELQKDITAATAGSTRSGAVVDLALGSLTAFPSLNQHSGTTEPSVGRFYNTGTNEYYDVSDGSGVLSFPLFRCNFSVDVGYTEVTELYNGFGYIGSTVWIDKGVKGLIPNGRNEDGSLKNIEFVTDTLLTKTVVSGGVGDVLILLDKDKNIQGETLTTTITYDATSNYTLYFDTPQTWIPMVYFGINNSVITSFYHKQPFRAVDYGDKPTITSWGFPSNKSVTLSVGASGSVYTAPANGWFNARGVITSGQYIEFTVQANGLNVVTQDVDSTAHTILCPVSKGQGVVFGYNATSITLRFIYAEGEV